MIVYCTGGMYGRLNRLLSRHCVQISVRTAHVSTRWLNSDVARSVSSSALVRIHLRDACLHRCCAVLVSGSPAKRGMLCIDVCGHEEAWGCVWRCYSDKRHSCILTFKRDKSQFPVWRHSWVDRQFSRFGCHLVCSYPAWEFHTRSSSTCSCIPWRLAFPVASLQVMLIAHVWRYKVGKCEEEGFQSPAARHLMLRVREGPQSTVQQWATRERVLQDHNQSTRSRWWEMFHMVSRFQLWSARVANAPYRCSVPAAMN